MTTSPKIGVQPQTDLRCDCGSLLGRLVLGGVEVKCRRCRRAVLLPFSSLLRGREGWEGEAPD